jgi:hypothetical protein
MKVLPALLLIAATALTTAHADCRMPKGPDTIPDGSLAKLEEMLEAQKAVKQFDADVGAYQTCLENEHNDAMSREGDKLSEDQKKERIRMLAQKQNAAADEAQALANRFNEQVKVYREKNKKQ